MKTNYQCPVSIRLTADQRRRVKQAAEIVEARTRHSYMVDTLMNRTDRILREQRKRRVEGEAAE